MGANKISTFSGFLFLINIIIGTGVFLNTVPLCGLLKGYSFLSYMITGILMIPIIFLTYILASIYPGYNMTSLLEVHFGSLKSILTPLYAFAKLATACIGILFMSNLIKKIFLLGVLDSSIGALVFIYVLFCLFVLFNFSFHPVLQRMIVFFKLIPILLILAYCLYIYFFGEFIAVSDALFSDAFDYYKLAQGASITIFAFAGFESLFAIVDLLKDKKKSALLLFFSFFISLILYILYQFSIFYLLSYSSIVVSGNESLWQCLESCFWGFRFSAIFIFLINIAIIMSSFGVSLGIMHATVNNLYCSIPFLFKKNILFVKLTMFAVMILYLYFGRINLFILQQFSSLGTIVLYFLLLISFYRLNKYRLICIIGLMSIILFFSIHVYNAFYYFGFMGYLFYGILLLILLVIYIYRKIFGYEL